MSRAKYKKWTSQKGQELIRGWIKEGLLDKEVAEKMETSPAQLARWKKEHKAINEAFSERGTYVDFHKDVKKVDLSEPGKRVGMTTMQKLFADYYIDSRDVVRSYIKAYYESQGREYQKEDMPTIQVMAYQLRRNKKIIAYVDKVIEDRRESDAMRPDDIVMRLTEIINNAASDQKTVLRAMDMLGKHYKMFNQQENANSASEVTINLTNFKTEKEE